ncbi:MAG: hypothetical protein FXF54_04590 [Kosmotoga sp.]|nr:MAG: hypothetical protein FXF54_04590 [Kosmotoga sp.]
MKIAKEMYLNGYSIRYISRELKIDWRTATKYIKYQGRMLNASRKRRSILDPYKKTIITLNHKRKTIVNNNHKLTICDNKKITILRL